MTVVGIGTDLVDVARMRRVLARTPTFAERVFTEGERALAASRRDAAKPLAARFAAKEAVMKALGLGLGEVRLADIEVVRSGSGAPAIVLSGPAVERAAAAGVDRFLVSLSHTDTTAVAVVVALGPG